LQRGGRALNVKLKRNKRIRRNLGMAGIETLNAWGGKKKKEKNVMKHQKRADKSVKAPMGEGFCYEEKPKRGS